MSSGPNIPRTRRKRRGREFTLSDPVNKRIDELLKADENISSIADEAFRAHPKFNLPPKDEP